jgi:hypothetical protein
MKGKAAVGMSNKPTPARRPITAPTPRRGLPPVAKGPSVKVPGIAKRPMPHRRTVPAPGRVVPPVVMVQPDAVKPLPLVEHERRRRARRFPPLSPRLRKKL